MGERVESGRDSRHGQRKEEADVRFGEQLDDVSLGRSSGADFRAGKVGRTHLCSLRYRVVRSENLREKTWRRERERERAERGFKGLETSDASSRFGRLKSAPTNALDATRRTVGTGRGASGIYNSAYVTKAISVWTKEGKRAREKTRGQL